MIYNTRPLSCRAYPAIKENKKAAELDCNCQFSCKYSAKVSKKNLLDNELKALTMISNKFQGFEDQKIWRYATHVGDKHSKVLLPRGWYLQT